MASEPGERLIELISSARRVALVGLAKNTGKTQTLGAILAEHAGEGVNVGVTSIGRDGEEHDVIDARIQKPRIHLREGTLLATTGGPPGPTIGDTRSNALVSRFFTGSPS